MTGLRLVAVMLAFALYTVVLDPDDQLALVSRFSFRSGLVVSLATRLFPVLQRDAGRIADAQRSRGVELDRGPRRARAVARVPLLAALFAQSLERAMDVGSAMTARGYGRRGRTRWQGTAAGVPATASPSRPPAWPPWPSWAGWSPALFTTTTSRCSTTRGRRSPAPGGWRPSPPSSRRSCWS